MNVTKVRLSPEPESEKGLGERRAELLTLASHDDCGQRRRVMCLHAPLGLLEEKEKEIIKKTKAVSTASLLSDFKKPRAGGVPA